VTEPGLDAAALTALLPSARRRSTGVLDAVRAHLTQHSGYVSWSGGKDSTTVLDLARQVDPGVPVCFFDSGLEYPETYTYINDLADKWNLNLHTIKAEPDALTIMASNGAWDHSAEVNWDTPDLHDTLITVPAQKARAQFGAAELWGLRALESTPRRILLSPGNGKITRADGTVAYSPIWNWRDIDVTGHLAGRGIPEHPVYAKLRALGASKKDLRVGLAFDGNSLQHGKVTYLRRGWPDLYARIVAALPRVAEWR
jgi:phosphoadenosine phosphosulfate reductase